MEYFLPDGISIDNVSRLKNAYEKTENGFTFQAGANILADILTDLCALIPEPVFFFLELPCSDEEEKEFDGGAHYKLYYLDNCTAPVIRALIKEYGSLLVNDGICRFGFGGNKCGDEIYVKLYKITDVFFSDKKRQARALEIMEKYQLEEQKPLITAWDIISEDDPGVCVQTEEDGISLFDLPEMLSKAGMYFAEIVE